MGGYKDGRANTSTERQIDSRTTRRLKRWREVRLGSECRVIFPRRWRNATWAALHKTEWRPADISRSPERKIRGKSDELFQRFRQIAQWQRKSPPTLRNNRLLACWWQIQFTPSNPCQLDKPVWLGPNRLRRCPSTSSGTSTPHSNPSHRWFAQAKTNIKQMSKY